MKKFLTITALFIFILYPLSAGAIPSLGVAPAESEYGTYYYNPADCLDCDDEEWEAEYGYMEYFVDEFIALGGDTPGFIMPASGGQLTVWYGAADGVVDLDVNIYLATNSAAGDSFNFDGNEFGIVTEDESNTAGGYKPLPYYGVLLGPVSDGDNWEVLPEDAGWSGTWYIYTGTIEYSDFLLEEWMFAIADMDNEGSS